MTEEPTIEFKNKTVKLTAEPNVNIEDALNSNPFKTWFEDLPMTKFELHSVHFQSVDYFGQRVGFVKFKASITFNGKFVPGIVFARGGAVAILVKVICKETNEEYSVLTVQPRVPIPSSGFPEIPAGMLDDETEKFSGVAAKEMEEETGIIVKTSDLIDLTKLVYGERFRGSVYPSPGGCDEFIKLYYYQTEMGQEKLEELNNKMTGLLEEREQITLKIVKFDELWKETSDCKTLSALFLYEKLKKEGVIKK
ncbi:nudix hydrolase 14 [Anaeramoeba flamelloides]|uniref:Nudix hydrolase 14 n=1 Tax=Anaeramoeba flamelloides TaxID=1746091 RepID=A0AAV7ZGU1_9EUKA|nr:nudix hydrolase 14 [Anaeramoeba flamelloides]KAJ6248029.1 nudix hydrolase 14 [Anaeramoeba flamelloides]